MAAAREDARHSHPTTPRAKYAESAPPRHSGIGAVRDRNIAEERDVLNVSFSGTGAKPTPGTGNGAG
jgi:hypothetical protein